MVSESAGLYGLLIVEGMLLVSSFTRRLNTLKPPLGFMVFGDSIIPLWRFLYNIKVDFLLVLSAFCESEIGYVDFGQRRQRR